MLIIEIIIVMLVSIFCVVHRANLGHRISSGKDFFFLLEYLFSHYNFSDEHD